jgi:tetratricopeptide (TPR) repeat protein
VARHLVMAGRLAEDDPEAAYRHAKAARRLASRVGLVREAAGLAAYHAGEWAEALAELRAARRLSTSEDAYLPVMADCERGLGRPERALDLVKSPEAKKLDQAGRIELRIVESGARRDLGQYDAAVVTLQVPELRDRRLRPWSARLFYAYADALVDAQREEEAAEWFARAAAADRDGETDAAERYAELEGLHILDTEEDGPEEHGGVPADAEAGGAAASQAVEEAPAAPETSGPEAETPDAAADVDVAGEDEPEATGPTSIEFRPAQPEPASERVSEAPEEPAEPAPGPEAPGAPAVFLEPQNAEEPDERSPDEDN